jgi:hypothetical protein
MMLTPALVGAWFSVEGIHFSKIRQWLGAAVCITMITTMNLHYDNNSDDNL